VTTSEIVIEFIKGRPLTTEREVRRVVNDPWKAPETIPGLVAETE
jgi:hypothetical protein